MFLLFLNLEFRFDQSEQRIRKHIQYQQQYSSHLRQDLKKINPMRASNSKAKFKNIPVNNVSTFEISYGITKFKIFSTAITFLSSF